MASEIVGLIVRVSDIMALETSCWLTEVCEGVILEVDSTVENVSIKCMVEEFVTVALTTGPMKQISLTVNNNTFLWYHAIQWRIIPSMTNERGD